jgi:hypothetical protein
MKDKPSYLNFDSITYKWKKDIDYRQYPELYKVGKGEQGVLICQPYKSELCPHWHFKTPDLARESSDRIYALFLSYLQKGEFVGADLARKYLQMGYTRARRYTNYKGGKKYGEGYKLLPKGTGDPVKSTCADIFYEKWRQAEENPEYACLKQAWKKKYG